MAKSVDVVVWGATGITGKRVCQQLATLYHSKVSWAIAGRNEQKLNKLKTELRDLNRECGEVPIIVADVQNRESIDSMVKQTSLVLSCAGPFPLYSDTVVESCVDQGSHFLDVTGEVLWVRSVIDRFHELAKSKNVKVVNCCGFDSVPADIGTFFLADYVHKRYGRGLSRVLGAYSSSGSEGFPLSGGTMASIFNISDAEPNTSSKVNDPYILNPLDKRPEDNPADHYTPRFDKDFEIWKAPFIMQSINTRVVRRSNALVPRAYGKQCSYAECTPSTSFIGAFGSSFLLGFFGFLLYFRFIRNFMLSMGLLPKPGEGPSVEAETKAKWQCELYGLVEPEDNPAVNASPVIVKARIGDKFGGYSSTARMVVECAMCQTLDKAKLANAGLPEGGVLTPAAAFGLVLVERLASIDIKTQVLE